MGSVRKEAVTGSANSSVLKAVCPASRTAAELLNLMNSKLEEDGKLVLCHPLFIYIDT